MFFWKSTGVVKGSQPSRGSHDSGFPVTAVSGPATPLPPQKMPLLYTLSPQAINVQASVTSHTDEPREQFHLYLRAECPEGPLTSLVARVLHSESNLRHNKCQT
jgi:hypothetical protein